MEYLKKKKMTADLYKPIKQGVDIVRSGTAAYNSEFNNFYQLLNTLSDNHVCKLAYLDTLPAVRI